MRRDVRLRYVLTPREVVDRSDLQVLSVYRDHGVVPKDSRTDNFNKTPVDLSRYQEVREGDLVVNKMKAWQGSLAVSGYHGIVSPDYQVCAVAPAVDGRYLHYLLRSSPLVSEYGARSKGIRPSQWRLYWDDLAEVRVNLPPRTEQRRIADFLDDAASRAELLADALHRARSLLVERFASCLGDAFVGLNSYALPLRRVVARWIDYRGATPAKSDDGVPLVTAGSIANGAIDLGRAPQFLDVGDYRVWMRRGFPQVNDVLLTTEAPLGEVAMIEDANVALAQRVILMRPADSIDARWLYWYLRSPIGQAELYKRATGSTALGIKADRLRSVPIQLFDRSEMGARLESLVGRLAGHNQGCGLIDRQLSLLRERQQALVTAAVTGQFDVTTAGGVDLS